MPVYDSQRGFLIEAIILAGGTGTRLQGVVRDVPKPMADINGKPFICYLFDYLSAYDVKKILLSVGYRYEIIRDYFGSQYKDMDIRYVIEDRPLGTGGALKKALMVAEGEEFIVLNGDTFFCIDLNKMLTFHYEHDADLTIAIKPMNNIDRYGTLILDKNRVTGFQEKTFMEFGYINGGVYIISKKIFKSFPEDKKVFSFEVDFLERACLYLKAFAFISDAYFIDIGVPEDYQKARIELGGEK